MRPTRSWAWLAVIGVLAVACRGADDPAARRTVPASPPPAVDLSIHDVPLEDVYFDTFDGRSVRLSDSTPELRESLLDTIPPIDHPVYGDTSTGDWLDPDSLVLGYEAGGQAYAYPFRILNYHEIVNDEIDGVPVLISYCPLCRSAIVYDRRIDGEAVSFGNTSALYESDLVMVDRTTGSYWWQVPGVAIVGTLTGAELDPLPSRVATWEGWVENHPDTLVLTRDTGFDRPYLREPFADYGDRVDAGQFAFPVGEAARDPRLTPATLVVGVQIDGVTRAYPIEALTEPIRDEIAGVAIHVVPGGGGADVFRTDESGEPGEPLPSRTTFWFAFVGAFPDVEVGHVGP